MKTKKLVTVAQHTPGPWEVDWNREYHRYQLRSPQGSFGHFCGWAADGVTTEDEDNANAKLIEAAPCLLQACQESIAWFELREHQSKPVFAQDCQVGRNLIAQLHAAIARATGQGR